MPALAFGAEVGAEFAHGALPFFEEGSGCVVCRVLAWEDGFTAYSFGEFFVVSLGFLEHGGWRFGRGEVQVFEDVVYLAHIVCWILRHRASSLRLRSWLI